LCPRETGDVKDFHRGGSDIGVDHTIHWDSGDLGAVDPAVLSRGPGAGGAEGACQLQHVMRHLR